MQHIIPAIIPTSASMLVATVEALCFAPRIQVDIVDGVFAATPSWPYAPSGDVDEVSQIFERHEIMVDIMALDQVAAAAAWLEAGAREIVVHLEALATLDEIIALKGKYEYKLWVAGNDTLPIDHYVRVAEDIDGVQLMGIHTIGMQGQPFSDRVLSNIAELKVALPNMPIMIDGSVNTDSIKKLHDAGASHYVVGSALTGQEDKRGAYEVLRKLVQ